MRIFLITVICLSLTAPAFAGIYKWTDKDGKIHFTDSLSKVPLDQRTKRHIRKMKSKEAVSTGVSGIPHDPPKTPGAQMGSSHSNDTGVDQQRVKDLLRLNQKKHYDHK